MNITKLQAITPYKENIKCGIFQKEDHKEHETKNIDKEI